MTVRRISHAHIDPTARCPSCSVPHPCSCRTWRSQGPHRAISASGMTGGTSSAPSGADVTGPSDAESQSETPTLGKLRQHASSASSPCASPRSGRGHCPELAPLDAKRRGNARDPLITAHGTTGTPGRQFPPNGLEIGQPSLRLARHRTRRPVTTPETRPCAAANPQTRSSRGLGTTVKDAALFPLKLGRRLHPLLEMADPDEAPPRIAARADIGKGPPWSTPP